MIEVGKKYYLNFGKNNINTKTIHIRAIVDGFQVVFKYWSKKRKTWDYQLNSTFYFSLLERDHIIKEIPQKREIAKLFDPKTDTYVKSTDPAL
jgi:hypothetical protein